MPKFVLSAATPEATIPHGLVVVRAYLSSPGAAAVPVIVTAVRGDGSLVPEPAIPPPPGTTVLAADQVDDVNLRARMTGGYPPASQLTVMIEVGVHAVQVGPLPVGGLSTQDVASLSAAEGRLRVRGGAGDVADGVSLSRIAESARAAASEILGVSRVAAIERFDAALVLDGSASMSVEALRDAALTVVEVLAGVASVVAARPEISVAVSGAPPLGPAPVALSAATETVTERWQSRGLASGARLGHGALYRGVPDTNTVSWVVTDDVPATLDALVAVNETPGSAVHLVVLAPGGQTASTEVDGIPVTRIARDDLAVVETASVPRRVIVESLLRGCFAPGTASYGRVRS